MHFKAAPELADLDNIRQLKRMIRQWNPPGLTGEAEAVKSVRMPDAFHLSFLGKRGGQPVAALSPPLADVHLRRPGLLPRLTVFTMDFLASVIQPAEEDELAGLLARVRRLREQNWIIRQQRDAQIVIVAATTEQLRAAVAECRRACRLI